MLFIECETGRGGIWKHPHPRRPCRESNRSDRRMIFPWRGHLRKCALRRLRQRARIQGGRPYVRNLRASHESLPYLCTRWPEKLITQVAFSYWGVIIRKAETARKTDQLPRGAGNLRIPATARKADPHPEETQAIRRKKDPSRRTM